MGQGAMLRIRNLTDVPLIRTYTYHYQVDGWNIPLTIDADKGFQFYFEFHYVPGIFGIGKDYKDDNGIGIYQVGTTDLQIELKADGYLDEKRNEQFRIRVKNNWPDGKYLVDRLPVYLQIHTSKEHYYLPSHDYSAIAEKVKDGTKGYQIYEYTITTVRRFCNNDKEALNITNKIINQQYADPEVRAFFEKVNAKAAACPFK